MTNFRKYNWKDKEQIIIDLKRSTSMCDFLINVGFKSPAGNYDTFRKNIIEHGIDLTNIYMPKDSRLRKSTKRKLDDKDIFCSNSNFDRGTLKQLLINKKLIPYECSCCKNKGLWNNKILVLQIEHKNGDNKDNRLENLEFLCPNCHSQTPTYCSKNKHTILFNQRVNQLKSHNISIISQENVKQISLLWGIKYVSISDWCFNHRQKLKLEGIEVDITSNKFTHEKLNFEKFINEKIRNFKSIQDFATDLSMSEQESLNIIKIYDKNLYLKLTEVNNGIEFINQRLKDLNSITDIDKSINILSKKWSIPEDDVTAWIKINNHKYYLKILENNYLKNENIKVANKLILTALADEEKHQENNFRLQSVSLLTNKKEVPTLAQSWNMSTNGAKKWIRNNAPDKFSEIYDDKHLEKNKVLALKLEKMNYIKNLAIDNFNLEDFIKDYGGNKAGAYAILSKYNRVLFEHISKTPDCACGGKTRTSGTNNDKVVYKCKTCTKSFSIA